MDNPYSPLGQYASDSSKRPSKRGKDEQYGKSFVKKRRLDETNSAALKDDDEDDEEDDDEGNESYDENEYDACEGENVEDAEVESLSSDGEHEESPHPLQSILSNLESQVTELQEKQRVLVERKEDREWRQRNYMYVDRKYATITSER